MRTSFLPAVSVLTAALALGCAGPSAEPAPAPPAPSAPAAQPPGTPFDPCGVATGDEVAEIIEGEVTATTPSTVAGTDLCTYVTDFDSPQIVAQTGSLTSDLATVAGYAAAQLGGATVTDTQVDGADGAVVVNGSLDGTPAVAVVAAVRGVYVKVLVNNAGDANEPYANEIAALLVAG